MALHVNSTSVGTPTSPYDTWEKAAATIGACTSVAVAGDEVFVHPSHNESAGANIGWTGSTATNPIKIICGTPNTGAGAAGISALQNTAIWGVPAASNVSWSGASFYVHGIQFRSIGSSGSGAVIINSTTAGLATLNDCQFYFSGSGMPTMIFGSQSFVGSITVLNNCGLRYGTANQQFRFTNRVIATNLYVIAGSVTPVSMFSVGYATVTMANLTRIDGLDFSAVANTTKLTNAFATLSSFRVRNVKCPSGWGVAGGTITTADILSGSELELLNYGDGDTNHRFWIEDRQGRAVSEDTIKISDDALASGNSTVTYSKRLTTLANVAYPMSVYRGPAITKYVEANGQYKGISLRVAHDGATIFTNKEFWIEVSFRGTSGSSLATTSSSCPSYRTSATALQDSSAVWEGFTSGVTTGPNGTSTWYTRYAYEGGLAVMEDGWITVTPCFAVPGKTIFINDDFLVDDEGPI